MSARLPELNGVAGALDEGTSTSSRTCWRPTSSSYSDGGGKVRAARYPIAGADHVARFFG
jgi:hypothetical protein